MTTEELKSKLSAIAYSDMAYYQQINAGLEILQAFKDAGGKGEDARNVLSEMADESPGDESVMYAITGISSFSDRFCFPIKPDWDMDKVRRTAVETITQARATNSTVAIRWNRL